MRRPIFTLFALFLALFTLAQSPKEEFKRNLRLSGSNFLAYPTPQQLKLTPAPKGKHPFYISHYGRHGSRYMTKASDYEFALNILRKADSQGALNELGRDVLQRLTIIHDHGREHIGDLTPLGMQQQRDIARRMYERFPEIFGSHTTAIDARSTTTSRCVVSMAVFVQQLAQLNPRLHISQDASVADLHYLKGLTPVDAKRDAKEKFDDYCRRHACYQRVTASLFADTAYLNRYVSAERLNYYLFRTASALQSTELSKKMTLYDLFTDEEIHQNWLMENAYWFLGYGYSDLNGGDMPLSQSDLLRNIILTADSCLHLPHPSCTLRFGHDTMLLPLTCLLGLNGYDQKINDLEQLERKGWVNYRVFPMSGNVQFVFYRSSPADPDIVFKVLLNECEATLPLKTDIAPYYHWSDFREHYLEKMTNNESSK